MTAELQRILGEYPPPPLLPSQFLRSVKHLSRDNLDFDSGCNR